MFYSPLRYPGGKYRLAKLIADICVMNQINGHYVEPYAGGASVALHLLLENKVRKITINDYDRSIYAFWYAVLYDTEAFCQRIVETEVTLDNWYKEKAVQKNKGEVPLLRLGFSTFFLNRTNVSGILSGGMIGGVKQAGRYKIGCRFNKQALIRRIRMIAAHRERIALYNVDALDLVHGLQGGGVDGGTIFYFDPPYYDKGPSLYMNCYNDAQHRELCKAIVGIQKAHWVISYDDTPEIAEIYGVIPPARRKRYLLKHSAYRSKSGKEVLFFSGGLVLSDGSIEKVGRSIRFVAPRRGLFD